jgi:hypothetical protein
VRKWFVEVWMAKCLELECIGCGGKLCGTGLYRFRGKLILTVKYRFRGDIVWNWTV